VRGLQDLPIQGAPTTLELRSGRWKCRNEQCARRTFAEKLAIALPFARKTRRVGELVRLFGPTAGGRVSERLLASLGIPISDSAVLRQLKSHVRKRRETKPLRAIAIDDWSWRKGSAYGTIIVDLERRRVGGRAEDPICAGNGGLAKSASRDRNRQP
jgi:transposase